MNVHQALQSTSGMSSVVLTKYVDDLTDAELLRRPAPGCNHLAWQLGHLVASSAQLLEAIRPDMAVTLPEGFAEAHSPEMSDVDDPAQFKSKTEYLELLEQVQSAAIDALDTYSEADLDEPAPEFLRAMFPTVGDVFVLIAAHGLMHSGQFVPVRRALQKPIVI